MSVIEFRRDNPVSIRRLALAFDEAVSTVGRWVGPKRLVEPKKRYCPVSGDVYLRSKVWQLCHEPRHLMFGHRRIWALLRRCGWFVNKKTV